MTAQHRKNLDTSQFHQLSGVWNSFDHQEAESVVDEFASVLNTRAVSKRAVENGCLFHIELPNIFLRGMDNVPCLFVGGNDAATASTIRLFTVRNTVPRKLPFVLAACKQTAEIVRQIVPQRRCLILEPVDVIALLAADESVELLKVYLRTQIPKRRLIPYSFTHPATGNMFFGRRSYLEQLHDEDHVSFVIAGPSRLGKTSLVRQYYDEVVRKHERRASRLFYIDFYNCPDARPESVIDHITMRVGRPRVTVHRPPERFADYMKYQRMVSGGPIELLLDELDGVCASQAFGYVGNAVRDGSCRVILCGRGTLLNSVFSENFRLDCRLDLMQLEPLDRSAAEQLLLGPLTDLGIEISASDKMIERVMDLTGSMPHFLQIYGHRLATRAIEREREFVNLKDVEHIRLSYDTVTYYSRSFDELSSGDNLSIAVLLLKSGHRNWTVNGVRRLATENGIKLDVGETEGVCRDLLVNNIFSWGGDRYRIANQALAGYARMLGLIDAL